MLDQVRDALDRQAFHEALEAIWVVIRAANAYVDHQAPWKLRKEDPDRMATVLYVLAETIRRLAILTQPFMPDTSAGMLDQLAQGEAFGRAAEPWEVAATIAFLASDYSSYLTGEVISVSSQHP